MRRLIYLLLLAIFGLAAFSAPAETPTRKRRKSTPAAAKEEDPTPPPSPARKPSPTPTPTPGPTPVGKRYGPNVALDPSELAEFPRLSSRVQALIRSGMTLARQNLTYTFGSAEPSRGGMDCSGTIYYLLRSSGFRDVPRDSSSQCAWLQKTGTFRPVATQSLTSRELAALQPGDLLFWTGTYQTQRAGAVSHVMLYLGTEKRTGRPVMFGASDGRSYGGMQRYGVSVFDFRMPKVDPANPERQKASFIGYGRIPGMNTDKPAELAAEEPAPETPKATPKPSPRPRKKS